MCGDHSSSDVNANAVVNEQIKSFLADSEVLLNAVDEGIYGFDSAGRAVFINPAAERMTGWQATELLGKNIHEYHHHSHADGSHYPAEECKIYATVRDGLAKRVSDEVFWRRDGSSFPVEYTTTPVIVAGETVGAIAVFRDITLQKQTEQQLRTALAEINQLTEQLKAENTYLQSELEQEWPVAGLVGSSPSFANMLQQLELVAKTDSTVLILGENGTGKELVARNIHALSLRKNSTLVSVNCAAFTPSLLESELFGHEKGSFSGATERRKGRFELANNATLFLDEVGELSLTAQSKLLRVLQEQEFERVGGTETLKVDIRLIAATNRDLKKMVEEGQFRADLYYRLNVFPLPVPPLRERVDDIPDLCQAILHKINHKLSKNIRAISNKSLNKLKLYAWPGNVRELQNVLEREAILTPSGILELRTQLSNDADLASSNLISMAQAERQHIEAVLEHCNWRISGEKGASTILGMPESTLRSKMKKLGVVKAQR